MQRPTTDPSLAKALHLGKRLKEFRLARKLSLRDLGAQTGTTASFLSQLERGTSGAAVSTLMRIAEALAISVADLFQDSDAPLHRVLRRGERPALQQTDGFRKILLSQPPIRAFEVYVGIFDPGGSTGQMPFAQGDSQEMMLVLAGTVDIKLGPDTHRLREGDCIEYQSSIPRSITNAGPLVAEVQWITSPAISSRDMLADFTRKP